MWVCVQFVYNKGTGTTHVLDVVNIMAAAPTPKPGQRARKAPVLHATAYELPLLLPVMRMLPQLNKAILATRNKKVRHERDSCGVGRHNKTSIGELHASLGLRV